MENLSIHSYVNINFLKRLYEHLQVFYVSLQCHWKSLAEPFFNVWLKFLQLGVNREFNLTVMFSYESLTKILRTTSKLLFQESLFLQCD